nr:hypothetical protein BaRGS_017590 [Batillaria attramentaria]
MAKDETIRILYAKLKRLEHLLHLKDLRIEDLESRLNHAQVLENVGWGLVGQAALTQGCVCHAYPLEVGSEATVACAQAELEELYTWIDGIPLTRPKRNIARDFADGDCVLEFPCACLGG